MAHRVLGEQVTKPRHQARSGLRRVPQRGQGEQALQKGTPVGRVAEERLVREGQASQGALDAAGEEAVSQADGLVGVRVAVDLGVAQAAGRRAALEHGAVQGRHLVERVGGERSHRLGQVAAGARLDERAPVEEANRRARDAEADGDLRADVHGLDVGS